MYCGSFFFHTMYLTSSYVALILMHCHKHCDSERRHATNWQTSVVFFVCFFIFFLHKLSEAKHSDGKFWGWCTHTLLEQLLALLVIKRRTVWLIETGPAQRRKLSNKLLRAHLPPGGPRMKWTCTEFGGCGLCCNLFWDQMPNNGQSFFLENTKFGRL